MEWDETPRGDSDRPCAPCTRATRHEGSGPRASRSRRPMESQTPCIYGARRRRAEANIAALVVTSKQHCRTGKVGIRRISSQQGHSPDKILIHTLTSRRKLFSAPGLTRTGMPSRIPLRDRGHHISATGRSSQRRRCTTEGIAVREKRASPSHQKLPMRRNSRLPHIYHMPGSPKQAPISPCPENRQSSLKIILGNQ